MEKYQHFCEPWADSASVIVGDCYRFTLLGDMVLRYEWAADGAFEDRASTFAMNRRFAAPKFRVNDSANELEIVTDSMYLTYDKKRFSSNGLCVTFKNKMTNWGSEWRYGSEPQRNLGGTARTLDEIDGRCELDVGILSRAGYSNIDDSESMLFDGSGWVAPRKPGDRSDGYLFSYGHDFKRAMKMFYAISGPQPVIPRWALGNWWSRYHAYTAVEYLSLMDKFEAYRIPLSVAVIDMDWHLVDGEEVPHSGWTGYTWNKKLFPNPVAFAEALHQRRLKITLNDHPHGGVHSHEEAYEGMARALDRDPNSRAPILFDPTSPQFMEAYLSKLHGDLEEAGCDFWWIDWQQGKESRIPGIDPLWVLNHFCFMDNSKKGNHPLVFSRYGGPGSHRYPVGFSGDTITTWESLEFQPEFTATASNIGYGWWSHDIGGHMHGVRDDELVVRWVQFGVFSPIMRLHSSNSRWQSKEPWLYRRESGALIQRYLQYRHRLVPYLYTMNVLGAVNSEPLIQPMYWSHPQEEEAYDVPNQYSMGTALVCAPIVQPRDTKTNLASVKVWIPPSRHVDIFTGLAYEGDQTLNLYRSLECIPVLAAEGSIVPLDGAQTPSNGCRNPESFEVLVVVGRDGDFVMFEENRDNNTASDREATESTSTPIKFRQSTGRLEAEITGGQWTFRFLSMKTELSHCKASVDGKEVEGMNVTTIAYPDIPSTLVQFPKLSTGRHTLIIDVGPDPQLAPPHRFEYLDDLIRDFQIEFDIKDKLWDICRGNRDTGIKVGELMSLGLDGTVIGPLLEIVCSIGGGKGVDVRARI